MAYNSYQRQQFNDWMNAQRDGMGFTMDQFNQYRANPDAFIQSTGWQPQNANTDVYNEQQAAMMQNQAPPPPVIGTAASAASALTASGQTPNLTPPAKPAVASLSDMSMSPAPRHTSMFGQPPKPPPPPPSSIPPPRAHRPDQIPSIDRPGLGWQPPPPRPAPTRQDPTPAPKRLDSMQTMMPQPMPNSGNVHQNEIEAPLTYEQKPLYNDDGSINQAGMIARAQAGWTQQQFNNAAPRTRPTMGTGNLNEQWNNNANVGNFNGGVASGSGAGATTDGSIPDSDLDSDTGGFDDQYYIDQDAQKFGSNNYDWNNRTQGPQNQGNINTNNQTQYSGTRNNQQGGQTGGNQQATTGGGIQTTGMGDNIHNPNNYDDLMRWRAGLGPPPAGVVFNGGNQQQGGQQGGNQQQGGQQGGNQQQGGNMNDNTWNTDRMGYSQINSPQSIGNPWDANAWSNYNAAMSKSFSQLDANADADQINARTNSILGLSTLPQQQFYNEMLPQVTGSMGEQYNTAANRQQNVPEMNAAWELGPNNVTTNAAYGMRDQVPGMVTAGTNTIGQSTGVNMPTNFMQNGLNPNLQLGLMFNETNKNTNTVDQGFMPGDLSAQGTGMAEAQALAQGLTPVNATIASSVTQPDTTALTAARNNISGDAGRSFTDQVTRGVQSLDRYSGPDEVAGTMQGAIDQAGSIGGLQLPRMLPDQGRINQSMRNVATAGENLLNNQNQLTSTLDATAGDALTDNSAVSSTMGDFDTSALQSNPNYQSAMTALTGDIDETFAEQSRQLEASLAASGNSNSTMANEQRKRLADQKARALASANLQALQIVGNERRSDMGTAANIENMAFGQNMGINQEGRADRLAGAEIANMAYGQQSDIARNLREDLGAAAGAVGALQDTQMQQGQFDINSQLAGSQDAQSRARLSGDLANQGFQQGLANEQLQLAGDAERRAGIGDIANIAGQYFDQNMGNRQLDMSQMAALDQAANSELQRAIAQGDYARAGQIQQYQNQLAQIGAMGDLAGLQNQRDIAGQGMQLDRANLDFQRRAAQAGLDQRDTEIAQGILQQFVDNQMAEGQFGLQKDAQQLAREQAEISRQLSEAGFTADQQQALFGNQMAARGFESSENQRGIGNAMAVMNNNENLYNQRWQQSQQPLTALLSAISGSNVAPGTVGPLQMPLQQQPGGGWQGAVGGIAGGLAGSFFGPAGTAAGTRFGNWIGTR